MTTDPPFDDLLRGLVPDVLAMLMRRYGSFDACEDAVQEALLAAAVQWRSGGVPDNPRAWLFTVAARRLTDQVRSDVARRRREATTMAMRQSAPDPDGAPDRDDTLTLLLLCCHPSLPALSQAALTLRAVGGLTTTEVARAFLTPEATMKQRISRAKQRLRASGEPFRPPAPEDLPARLRVVRHVLYLIFNEGYATGTGPDLVRTDLTREAIRLTRDLRRLRPGDPETDGLLALMLLTEARSPARTRDDGVPVPLDEQDRTRWDRVAVAEGTALITGALAAGTAGPYQVQAAIAAVHAEADRSADTDWPQILGLYDILQRISPSPVVALNRAVAVAMVHGPRAALGLLGSLEADDRLAGSHRLESARAHMLEMAGDHGAAADAYTSAANRAPGEAERRYLRERAGRLR
ncbi:sigma-70 family RNA polymerase sigma factor [Actinoplanes sp. NBRC 101535]|uniref:RNA polymerase sigma factor n=1 Tax=Actinoplanes sp. NBRC 101535 TaxID=3032196 RepID=UPI0024A5DC1C|nr:sigma-70 family RNA polymerase sigma factor [Actinoplanes sp. NBRC 101535]GLY00460.1 RNA polymerase sigma24 factor [Actinoplanes sp. NBRC 101535]